MLAAANGNILVAIDAKTPFRHCGGDTVVCALAFAEVSNQPTD